MEPEIARRCKACGASVRNHAGFCPQCGAPLNTEESNPVPQGEGSEVPLNQTMEAVEAQAPTPAITIGDAAPISDVALASDAPVVSEPVVAAPSEEIVSPSPAIIDVDGADGVGVAAESSIAATATTTAPTRRHRVKVAALDAVEGKIAPRVEKLRQASTVVLDEAADDPGLRFVLVAALLIILSLVLLLLSQILG